MTIDELTNAQLDRLADRLAARATQRQVEREAAEREKNDPKPLRPGIGSAGITFNDIARRTWDQACISANSKQVVPFQIAPMASLVARDGTRLREGQELRPSEHLDARKGDVMVQLERLVASGHVLAKAGVL